MNKFVLYLIAIFLAVDLCQIHQIISPIRYLRLGFLTGVPLIFIALFNINKYQGSKKLLFWRFVFLLAIATGLVFGYSRGKVWAIVNVDLIRYFAGFMTVCIFIRKLEDFAIVIKLLFITSLLSSIFVISHHGFGPGMLHDENDIASFLVMLLPIPYFMSYLSFSKFHINIFRIVFILNLIAIAATISRGGMVGAFPTLLFIWAKSKKKVITLSFFIVAILGAIFFAPPNLISEFNSIKDVDKGTAAGRIYFWKVSMDIFHVKPIFGVGANSWGQAIWEGIVPLEKNVSNITPHSMYFQLLSELGVVGSTVFIIFLIYTIKMVLELFSTIRQLKQTAQSLEQLHKIESINIYAQALLIGVIGFAICSAFISTLYYPHLYYYIFFLQVLANIAKKQRYTFLTGDGVMAGNMP